MADKDDEILLAAIKAQAEKEGKTPEELALEMLKARKDREAGSTALAGPTERGVERPERHEFKRTAMSSPHLSPERIAMYENESAAEARDRWYAEESMIDGGVLSPGGMSAGGIFGGGVIATESYDPESQMRYEQRAGAAVQMKTLEVLERMSKQLKETEEENRALRAGRDPRRLPGRGRGR